MQTTFMAAFPTRPRASAAGGSRRGERLARLDVRGRLGIRRRLVQDHAVEQAELAEPGLLRERPLGVGVTGLPARADAGRREVDVLGVALVVEPGASSRTTCMRVSQ